MKDWETDLDTFFSTTEQKQQDDAVKLVESQKVAADFLAQEVAPAFEEVKALLEKHGRKVESSVGTDEAHMTVHYHGNKELDYTVVCRVRPGFAVAIPLTRGYDGGEHYRAEGFFRSGAQDYGCEDLKKDEIINNLLDTYKQLVSRS